MEISFNSVNVPQKNNYSAIRVSPVSISEKHNQLTTIFLPERPTLEWHIVLPFHSILFLYFWNVLKNLQEIQKKTNKHYRKQLTEGPELLLEKQLLLALSLSGGCGRRGQNTENMLSSSQNTVPQWPGKPPASHRTPSQSCALLGLRVFICENTSLASLGGTLGQLNELQ